MDAGQTGWVKIFYNHPDEKALPVENGFAIVRVDQDLKLYTRSRMNTTWDGSKFYSQTADGKRVPLQVLQKGPPASSGDKIKSTDQAGDHEDFFVGGQQDFPRNLRMSKNVGSGFPETPIDPQEPGASDQSDKDKVLTDLPQ